MKCRVSGCEDEMFWCGERKAGEEREQSKYLKIYVRRDRAGEGGFIREEIKILNKDFLRREREREYVEVSGLVGSVWAPHGLALLAFLTYTPISLCTSSH